MIVIVDANIIISGIINPYGPIPEILLQIFNVDFIIPDYALTEIGLHKTRICKEAKIPIPLFDQLLEKLLSPVLVFSADSIDISHIEKAGKLTMSVDAKDIIYIAFCFAFDCLMWTGDLKLYRGLRRKGFKNIVTTKELSEIIKGI
jgi:predicted nucleic acid-binding protein